MAKVTIEDISQRTELSRGTISRALNDRPDISAKTKARVLEACAALNYVPSHAARSLATGRHYAIAVLVDNFQATFAAAFLRGVIGRAERAHYTTTVVEIPAEAGRAASRLRFLGTERLDGVLVAAPLADGLAEILCESAVGRTVASCWPIRGLSCDVLAPDLTESGRLAGLHALTDRGRVAYVDGASDHGSEQRRSGFEAACRERGVDPAGLVLTAAPSPSGGPNFESLRAPLLEAGAVVAGDDDLAIALMIWFGRNGQIAGENVAVIGQGNDPTGQRVAPTLTTVDFAGDEIGQRAANVVLQRLANTRQDLPQTHLVAPILRRRKYSACLPA